MWSMSLSCRQNMLCISIPAADITEGKQDPIYKVHSYHTKVPPRAIVQYILHYIRPGDILLDAFRGSGMTGVTMAILWVALLNPDVGVINQTLHLIGVANPPRWLSSSDWALPAVALMSLSIVFCSTFYPRASSKCAISVSSALPAANAWRCCASRSRMPVKIMIVNRRQANSPKFQLRSGYCAARFVGRLCDSSKLSNPLDAVHHEPIQLP